MSNIARYSKNTGGNSITKVWQMDRLIDWWMMDKVIPLWHFALLLPQNFRQTKFFFYVQWKSKKGRKFWCIDFYAIGICIDWIINI